MTCFVPNDGSVTIEDWNCVLHNIMAAVHYNLTNPPPQVTDNDRDLMFIVFSGAVATVIVSIFIWWYHSHHGR